MNQAEIDDNQQKINELSRLNKLRIELIRRYADTPFWHWQELRNMSHQIDQMREEWQRLAREWFPR